MAQGDVIIFNQFCEDESDKLHNGTSDVFYGALITSSVTPAKTTADPRWGAGGSTNFSTNEVTAGGNYSSGGVNLSTTITDNITRSGNVITFTLDNVSIAQNASNPTDARWLIVYNFTDAGKRCVCAVDLGSVRNLSAGLFTVTWSGSNVVFTKTNNS